MKKFIYGIDCSKIKDKAIIKKIELFLAGIEEKYPKDLATIMQKVKHIKPVPTTQRIEGWMGWWEEAKETVCISNELKDSEFTIGILAHELGHVCTTENDKKRRKCPDAEWEKEAVADWYACKWGYRKIISKLQNTSYKFTHHGCPSGKQVEQIFGDFKYTFTVSRNFVYKRISVETLGKTKEAKEAFAKAKELEK